MLDSRCEGHGNKHDRAAPALTGAKCQDTDYKYKINKKRKLARSAPKIKKKGQVLC